jgi:D-alanyl-D-alanine carboxypeptidase/D-alanyl-D-alanine-endopeptidase (penicillin-binding protein 4)
MPRRALLLALLLAPATLLAQTDTALARRIAAITTRPEFRHAIWGIEIYDLDAKKPIYALNENRLFVPASTTKLLTMGTALALLGTDYRFLTNVYTTGTLKPDGTLDGDIVIVASGDPNLSGRMRPDGTLAFENEDHAYAGSDTMARTVPGDPLTVIKQMANVVAARVKTVNGRILVDVSLFPEGQAEGGSGVIMSPMMVNDNVVDVWLAAGAKAGDVMVLTSQPATAYVTFVNKTTTGAAGSANTVSIASDSATPEGNHVVTIRGSLPVGWPKMLFAYDVPVPSRFAAVTFTEALQAKGTKVNAPKNPAPVDWVKLAAYYTNEHMVAQHISAPYSEEVKVTLKVSDNLHAAVTPFILGAIVGKKDTAKTGFDLEREFLVSAGLDVSGAQQADGEGANDHFTPAFMVSWLQYYTTRKEYPAFFTALPIMGKDGTLFDIQSASPAAGHVFAKTGTFGVGDPLNRNILVTAKGLAGYITTSNGRHLIIAAYVNNVAVAKGEDIKSVVGQAMGEVAAAAWAP